MPENKGFGKLSSGNHCQSTVLSGSTTLMLPDWYKPSIIIVRWGTNHGGIRFSRTPTTRFDKWIIASSPISSHNSLRAVSEIFSPVTWWPPGNTQGFCWWKWNYTWNRKERIIRRDWDQDRKINKIRIFEIIYWNHKRRSWDISSKKCYSMPRYENWWTWDYRS